MKKSGKMGRLELLGWINELMETDYPRIEALSDGIAYAQVLDLLYPKIVPLSKLTFNPRSEEDNAKNLRIVDDVLHRIKAKKTIDPLKLSRSKFPDNMEFAQWLFQHFLQMKDTVKGRYPAYAKRLEAYKKQRKIPPERTNFDLQMSSHLIPNEPLVDSSDASPASPDLNQQRLNQLRDLVLSLEQELTNQVSNYKLLQEDIAQVEEERNFYFNKLRQIELLCQNDTSETSRELIDIISAVPEEFLKAQG
ncbi:unnamed protein product [Blepharisma stoltei]|uniref:Uncharacterized protein n=1 Tax=Blepharisma stoltei TaxID=1481888 RepID=A0AAU9KAW3_9CILI|nr:unnamed protein product [Blepharisma stoltei]